MFDISWGLLILLAASAIFVVLGLPLGPVIVIGIVVGLLVAYRYPYFTFYSGIILSPLLGLTVSIPTGELTVGVRAFGGSIDIGIAEVVFLLLMVAWALKILFLWVRRHDRNWRPRFPLLGSYAALIGAHLLSAFSSLEPDPILVAKFALRPVLFCYLAYVALPVNFIRSRRRLIGALSAFTFSGMIAAMNGAVSLFFVDASSQYIRRAHPLPMFGVPALGDNHNLLAEFMVVTVMATLALHLLVRGTRAKRLLYGAAIFQGLIGLLTFSRTGWIVFALQALFIGVVEFRHILRRQAAVILTAIILLIPLAFVMTNISRSDVATSSNSTRLALLEIAYEVFTTSPWIGSGAGTFVDVVGSAQVFRIEYGDPLDAHGFIQKLAAETGIAGLAAFGSVCLEWMWFCYTVIRRMSQGPARLAVLYLVTGAGGALAYQLFNTDYWTAKMWLPIGLSVAACFVLSAKEEADRGVATSV